MISIVNGDYEIQPASLGAKSKVNGTPLTGPRVLTHKDRILFGKNFVEPTLFVPDQMLLYCVTVAFY